MMLRFKGDFAAEVDQWRAFCWRVAESKFLTGKAPASGDRKKPFRASIDWIVKPANLAKIINGNYDDGGGGDGPGGPRDINEVMG